MSDVIILGNRRAVCAFHFACALTGLAVVDMLPDEVEEVKEPEPIIFTLQAHKLSECYDTTDFYKELPPIVPRTVGRPVAAKSRSTHINRKILRCNRK